jgi:hypothetical protein
MNQSAISSSNPTFLTSADRMKCLSLAWPLSHDGREYHEVFIKRLTAREVADLLKNMKTKSETTPDEPVRWPMFFDRDGVAIPEQILDAMDDDDAFELEKVVSDFLPRRFPRGEASNDSTRPTGGSTEP